MRPVEITQVGIGHPASSHHSGVFEHADPYVNTSEGNSFGLLFFQVTGILCTDLLWFAHLWLWAVFQFER